MGQSQAAAFCTGRTEILEQGARAENMQVNILRPLIAAKFLTIDRQLLPAVVKAAQIIVQDGHFVVQQLEHFFYLVVAADKQDKGNEEDGGQQQGGCQTIIGTCQGEQQGEKADSPLQCQAAAFFLAVLSTTQGRMLQIGVKAGFLFICIMHDTRSFLTGQLAFICFYYMSYL
jgi:hypothetical protein